MIMRGLFGAEGIQARRLLDGCGKPSKFVEPPAAILRRAAWVFDVE